MYAIVTNVESRVDEQARLKREVEAVIGSLWETLRAEPVQLAVQWPTGSRLVGEPVTLSAVRRSANTVHVVASGPGGDVLLAMVMATYPCG